MRGRPAENVVKKMKYTIEFKDSRWHYNLNKYPNGPYLVEQLDLTYDKLGESSVCLSKFLDTDINIHSNFNPVENNYNKFLSNNIQLSKNISNIDKLKKINDSPKPCKLQHSNIRQNNKLEAINILHTGRETQLETQHLCDQISNSLKASDSDKKLAQTIDINIILSSNSLCSFLDSQIVLLKKYFTNVQRKPSIRNSYLSS